ncbi:MAG: hypothetical protein AB1714_11435 [Acidobacteriota bacterium]
MSDMEMQPTNPQAASEEAATSQAGPRGGFRNVSNALRHIRGAMAAQDVKQRRADRIMIGVVAVSVLTLLAAVVFTPPPLLIMAPLVVTFIALLVYVFHRMGIFLSVGPRQALIFWQLVIGSLWLGITAGLLVMLGSLYFTK